MTLRWRLRRILLLALTLLVLGAAIDQDWPWEPPFYYERATWDGRRWTPRPQPTEWETFWAWVRRP